MSLRRRHDPRFQTAFDGVLSEALRTRIGAVKGAYNFTLEELGQHLGFSASFVGNLLKGKKAIRTKHIARLVDQLAMLEKELSVPSPAGTQERKSLDEASLEDLARRANDLGFTVTFVQKEGLPAKPGALSNGDTDRCG